MHITSLSHTFRKNPVELFKGQEKWENVTENLGIRKFLSQGKVLNGRKSGYIRELANEKHTEILAVVITSAYIKIPT